MSTQKPTRADDCETMLRILADAPTEGLCIAQIQVETAKIGDPWPYHEINSVLTDLIAQIGHAKTRGKGGKVTRFYLKTRMNT